MGYPVSILPAVEVPAPAVIAPDNKVFAGVEGGKDRERFRTRGVGAAGDSSFVRCHDGKLQAQAVRQGGPGNNRTAGDIVASNGL